mgnify:CR=1 FL=1
MSILKDFIALVEGEGDSVDIRELFTDDNERLRWEKMVEVFEHIQIDRVKEGLLSVDSKYNLNREEQINILAYVKFLELMVIKMDAFKNEAEGKVSSYSPSQSSFDGSMYG